MSDELYNLVAALDLEKAEQQRRELHEKVDSIEREIYQRRAGL